MQVFYLSEDALRITAALPASGVWHDAVVAEVVAATHDAHEAAHLLSADTHRHDVAVGLGGGEFDVDGVAAVLTLGYKVGQSEIAVGTAHEIGVMVVYQVVFHSLRHAAQHAEDDLAALLLLCMEGFETVVYLVFSILPDAACIQKNSVCVVFLFAKFITRHLHHRSYNFAVCHVHLAAISLYEEFFHYFLYSFKIAYFGCEINKFKLYLQTSQRISTFRYISHSNRTKLLFYRH